MTWLQHFNDGEEIEGMSVQKAEKPCLRRAEVPAYLAQRHGIIVARSTLAKLATLGGGPRYHKVGRVVLYPLPELDQWSQDKLGPLRENTSSA